MKMLYKRGSVYALPILNIGGQVLRQWRIIFKKASSDKEAIEWANTIPSSLYKKSWGMSLLDFFEKNALHTIWGAGEDRLFIGSQSSVAIYANTQYVNNRHIDTPICEQETEDTNISFCVGKRSNCVSVDINLEYPIKVLWGHPEPGTFNELFFMGEQIGAWELIYTND